MPPPIAELCLFPAKIYSNAYNTTLSEPLPGCLHPSLSPPWCLTVYNAPKIQTPHQSLRIRAVISELSGVMTESVRFRRKRYERISSVRGRTGNLTHHAQHAHSISRMDSVMDFIAREPLLFINRIKREGQFRLCRGRRSAPNIRKSGQQFGQPRFACHIHLQ